MLSPQYSNGKYRETKSSRKTTLIKRFLILCVIAFIIFLFVRTLDQLSNTVTMLMEDVDTLQDEVADLTRTYRWDIGKLRADIQKQTVESKNSDNSGNSKTSNIVEIEQLNERVEYLENTVASLENKITSLQRDEQIEHSQRATFENEMDTSKIFSERLQYYDTHFLESELNNCNWIASLIHRNASIGAPLRKSGIDDDASPEEIAQKGPVFWLKQPLLHTRDQDTDLELILLKYNHYEDQEDQASVKFENSVKIALAFQDMKSKTGSTLQTFPQMYGFCDSITLPGESKPSKVLAMEYVEYDMHKLEKPTSANECINRALDGLSRFVELDEILHLVLVDVKAGQWMARKDKAIVLQDLDDIVRPGSVELYGTQLTVLSNLIRGANGLSPEQVQEIIFTEIFPNKHITIRYDMVAMLTFLNNLGFKWNDTHCPGLKPEFEDCMYELVEWAATVEENWPSPLQFRDAFISCRDTNHFKKSNRPPAAWRDSATALYQ